MQKRRKSMKRLVSWIVAIWMTLVAVCAGYAAALDYANPENWAVWESEKTRAADVFFFVPTVDLGTDGRSHMDVTDSTVASRFQNIGACFFGADGKMVKETPFLTGAYIDGARGTLIATDIVPADYHNKIFSDGVYHLYDHMSFYQNLQENVRVRTESFLRLDQ